MSRWDILRCKDRDIRVWFIIIHTGGSSRAEPLPEFRAVGSHDAVHWLGVNPGAARLA
jgi:hypothetical protein